MQGALADLEKQVTERMAELRQAVDRLSFEAARRQRAVSPEEAQFRSIFEAGSEGYLIHDDGIIVEVNPQLEALLGYESSELIGRSLMTLVAEESKALVAERLRTKPRKPYEITGVKKDGTRIQVEVVGKDHLHEGRPMAVVTIRDLTELKKTDEALREKDEWLKLAETAGGVGTFDWDIEKNAAKCSDQYYRLFGVEPGADVSLEEFLGRVHEDDLEGVQQAVADTLERGAPYAVDYRVRWPDRSIHWINSRAEVVKDGDGRPVRFLGAITDFTERKRLEEELQLAREELEGKVEGEMERANPYKLTFREFTVLHHLTDGEADKVIAAKLGISTHTVHKHVSNLLAKMDASSRTEASIRAVREGLVD